MRRRLRVAVEDAEIAVAHAESRDAPVAELPSVCRSLARVAGDLDGLLKLERRLPPGASRADVRRQVAEVIGAARDVQAAAVRAGSDATEPQVRSLVRHASDEVDIVSTALASMRSTARPHWRGDARCACQAERMPPSADSSSDLPDPIADVRACSARAS